MSRSHSSISQQPVELYFGCRTHSFGYLPADLSGETGNCGKHPASVGYGPLVRGLIGHVRPRSRRHLDAKGLLSDQARRSPWPRRRSMSAHASPPPVSMRMAWTTPCPGRAAGAAPRRRGCGPRANPRGAHGRRRRQRACSPAWATTPLPEPSTTAGIALLAFTWQVPSWLGFRTRRQRQNPLFGGHFRGWVTLSSRGSVNDQCLAHERRRGDPCSDTGII